MSKLIKCFLVLFFCQKTGFLHAFNSADLNSLVLEHSRHLPAEFTNGLSEVVAWIDFMEGRLDRNNFVVSQINKFLEEFEKEEAVARQNGVLIEPQHVNEHCEIKKEARDTIGKIKNREMNPDLNYLHDLSKKLANAAADFHTFPKPSKRPGLSLAKNIVNSFPVSSELGILPIIHAYLLGYYPIGLLFNNVMVHGGLFVGPAGFLAHDIGHVQEICSALSRSKIDLDYYRSAYPSLLMSIVNEENTEQMERILYWFIVLHEYAGDDEKIKYEETRYYSGRKADQLLFTSGDFFNLLNKYFPIEGGWGSEIVYFELFDSNHRPSSNSETEMRALKYNIKFVNFFKHLRDKFKPSQISAQ